MVERSRSRRLLPDCCPHSTPRDAVDPLLTTITPASTIAVWALPFEALYQDALRMIMEDQTGLTGFLLQLGPFGGAYVHGWPVRVWALMYLLAVGAAAIAPFCSKRPLAPRRPSDPRATDVIGEALAPGSSTS